MSDDKVEHVRGAKQTRHHLCHWPGCLTEVPSAMWGCKPHWFKLPRELRVAIWAAYQPGQEQDAGMVTVEYVRAARAADAWVRERELEAWR